MRRLVPAPARLARAVRQRVRPWRSKRLCGSRGTTPCVPLLQVLQEHAFFNYDLWLLVRVLPEAPEAFPKHPYTLSRSATLARLGACHADVKAPAADGIVATTLYCTNARVDDENGCRLAALRGDAATFRAEGAPSAAAVRPIFVARERGASEVRKLLELHDHHAPGAVDELFCRAVYGEHHKFPDLEGRVLRGLAVAVAKHDAEAYGVVPGAYDCPVVSFDNGALVAVKPATFF